ncbi:MAG: rod shape-determining protein MreD [Planctomycetota bacterium]|nr:rod shape-determining protein MreD [Planctomycetota bacterium]MDA1212733.1 rod shape-determining protein MreD [Planctomycetota bacterium]
MKHYYLAALLYIAAVLQMGDVVRFGEWFPNPVWIWLVLVAAVRHVDRPAVLVWGGVIGLCADCISAGPLGLQLICGVMIAGWMTTGRNALSPPRPIYVAVAAGMIVLMTAALQLSWSVFSSGSTMLGRDQLFSYFAPAWSTACAALIWELGRAGWFRLLRLTSRFHYAGYATR